MTNTSTKNLGPWHRAALVLLALVGVLVLPAKGAEPPGPEIAAQRSETLRQVRAAAAGRDLASLKANLAAAKKLQGVAAYDAEYLRLEELGDYLERFWQYVDKGGRALNAVDELKVGDQIVAVVEFDGSRLVLRVAGRNKTYTLSNLPPKLALTLAEQVLKREAPENKIFFGTFLLLDGAGDRQLARQYFDEAARGGVDVKRLLPEFEVPLVAPPPALPEMTPTLRAALAPKLWQIQGYAANDKGWAAGPSEGLAQAAEGHLQVAFPPSKAGANGADFRVSPARTLTANFGLRVFVRSEKAGLTCGLYAASGPETDGVFLELPPGTHLVELAREAGKFRARLNGQEVELKTEGLGAARGAVRFALAGQGGNSFTIAGIELANR